MSKFERSIRDFPYTRQNAERVIVMSREIVAAMTALSEYISKLPIPDKPHDLMEHNSFDAADFVMQFDELLERTFPELLPVDWGFEERA